VIKLDQKSDLLKRAKVEIESRHYLTLATGDKDLGPWNTPVYSAFDDNYHFYWVSEASSQHSKNIRANGKAFAVIYDSTVPEGTGFGVYIRGHCIELDAKNLDEIERAQKILAGRVGFNLKRLPTYYLPPNPRRMYRFEPSQVWVNTIVESPGQKVDRRVEITDCLLPPGPV
jgi:hypothetical protein